MSIEANKALARRAMQLVNERDIPALRDLYIEEYIHHDPAFTGGGARGWEEYHAAFSAFITAFPDLQLIVDDIAAEGDLVATRWHWTGTNTGPFNGMPPTGKPVDVPACSIQRIVDGKLVEGWTVFDVAVMMQQLGFTPAPAAV